MHSTLTRHCYCRIEGEDYAKGALQRVCSVRRSSVRDFTSVLLKQRAELPRLLGSEQNREGNVLVVGISLESDSCKGDRIIET